MFENNHSIPVPPGNKHALLIGSQVGNLRGQPKDLDEMESILRRYGFRITKCFSSDKDKDELPTKEVDKSSKATKSGIICAWENLIKRTEKDDAVVIYYTGHGMLSSWPNEPASNSHPPLQYILPSDFEHTTDGDWRGITEAELSILLRRTTNITRNTTMILDCCHSARMVRGPGIVKCPDQEDYGSIRAMIAGMMAKGDMEQYLHHEKNPHAVTIVATRQTEAAYEDKRYGMGILTWALTNALAEAIPETGSWTPNVSWRSIIRSVRDKVQFRFPTQEPSVESHDLRLTFSLHEANSKGVLFFSPELDDGEVALHGGRLHGVSINDVYSVQPIMAEHASQETEICKATVDDVGSLTSWVKLTLDSPQFDLSRVKAFPLEKAAATFGVDISHAGDLMEMLKDELTHCQTVRPWERAFPSPLATVSFRMPLLSLYSHEEDDSYLLRKWDIQRDGKSVDCVKDCIETLENLAWCQQFLKCPVDIPCEEIEACIRAEFGLVDNGEKKPFTQAASPQLKEGQKIYVDLVSISARPMYVSVFDVCATEITLLSKRKPDGVELSNNNSYTLGLREGGSRVVGQGIKWPKSTPMVDSIPDTLVVIATDRNIDLRNLQSKSQCQSRKGRTEQDTELTRLIGRIATGKRSVEQEGDTPVKFGMIRFPFTLVPDLETT
ncbi:peptidase c14 caspase catalytic subunit p20 [Fusarium heterosporum]|uniref:Peptidase c14 caspase catalytic subunit p20 n=1 Tax=Fusarium heterosporum TaxID=42747 RepID=A0A8H5TPU6_FUSHE|nr:peptidase c14 caspase catalytic subunit p20 [Fusarium heterosporum]